jgi:acyl-CoA reductase-like NAD-dependent aldehyde dehydrogenase
LAVISGTVKFSTYAPPLTAQVKVNRVADSARRQAVGGQGVAPSSDATIKVIDSGTEETYFTVAEAQAAEFTYDVDRARQVAGQLRSGTVGHNAFRTDFSVSFGGFKQSGIGREGVHEGLPHFLETKFVVLEGRPAGYEDTVL